MPQGTQISNQNFLIKQLPTAVAFINKRFEIVYASDKWMALHELEPAEVFGKRIDSFFTKLSDQWENTLKDCLSGKVEEIYVDYNLEDVSGDKWLEWSCNPWFDEDENIIGLVVRTEDVTQRKYEQKVLAKLQSVRKITSEIAKIGSWEYDVLQDKLLWCPMTKKIHEVSEDYIPNVESALNFYKDGYSRNTISMIFHETMEKGIKWSEKLQLITASGKEIWVRASGMPVFKNGQIIALTGTFQNIDTQVKSEAKTKNSEILLRTLIDNLPLNIYIKDRESRKILVNKAECDYLGVRDLNEILGKNNNELYDSDVADLLNREDLTVMETLQPILSKETEIRKKNGELTTFLISKIPLTNDDGKAYGLIGISHDISDLKRKEEEMHNLINVTSLQNKKLVNFAHIVSHNLRSHTANFSMLLEFLVNEVDESEKKNIINMLTNASDNLLETLENLNDVIAISTNVGLEKKSVNLNEKIDTVKKNLNAFLLNNNATIINTIPDHVEIDVVSSYIDSILMNFITNAVKYKDPERKPIVTLSATRDNGYTVLSIKDNGLGIDLKKYGDKLFGMYKTFHNHSDARGIGLYITKNQIEAMNGKVSVSSKVGKGTTFNIHFNEKN